jgi:hypothetical protein
MGDVSKKLRGLSDTYRDNAKNIMNDIKNVDIKILGSNLNPDDDQSPPDINLGKKTGIDDAIKAEEAKQKAIAEIVDKYNKEYMLSLLDENAREIAAINWKYDEELKALGLFDTESEAYKANRAARNREVEAKEIEQAKKLAYEKLRIREEIWMATHSGEEEELHNAELKYDKLIDLAVQNGFDTNKLEEMLAKEKANINDKYRKQEEDKDKEDKKKKRDRNLKYASDANSIAGAASDFVTSLKDYELQKAGDNEEKKKAILKKYADIEMLTNIAKITAATAVGAMQAYELGPVAGAIMSAIIIAEGIVELGLAVDQRNKIKGLEQGFYPKHILATRAQDGKQFTSRVSRDTRTQMIDFPTVFLAGEKGKSAPELMLDGMVVKDLQMNAPMVMDAISNSARKIHGFEKGFYDNLNLNRTAQPGMFDSRTIDIMERHAEAMEKMVNEGVSGKWVYRDLVKIQDKAGSIGKNFGG